MSDDEDGSPSGGESPRPSGRVLGSAMMCCLGAVVLPGALLLLAWNENRYVCANHQRLYAQDHAVSVGCDASEVQSTFVYFACPVLESSLQMFAPANFNFNWALPISFRGAAGSQHVDMYQCQEVCDAASGNLGKDVKRKCRYDMVWGHERINSQEFVQTPEAVEARKLGCPDLSEVPSGNPEFPRNLNVGESSSYGGSILAGDGPSSSFTISGGLIYQLPTDSPVDLTGYSDLFTGPLPPSSGVNPWARPITLDTSSLAVSHDGLSLESCNPPYRLGCIRIVYKRSFPKAVSVLARVSSSGQLAPEDIPSGWCPWARLEVLKVGNFSRDELIDSLSEEARYSVWVMRLAGLVAVILAVFCVLQPVSAAADITFDFEACSCLEALIERFEGMVEWLVCVISWNIGCCLSLVVIAVVWCFSRPSVCLWLLALAACCAGGALGAKKVLGTEDLRHHELERRRRKRRLRRAGDSEDSSSEAE